MFELYVIIEIILWIAIGVYYWMHERQQDARIRNLEKKVFTEEEVPNAERKR